MKRYLLGVDLGTTQVKAVIFDYDGNMIASATQGNYPIVSEHANWAEQDPEIWWSDTEAVIKNVVSQIQNRSEDIACVSVSSQGMAMLPLDEDGRPLSRAHIWMDRRAVEETKIMEEQMGRDYIKEHFGAYADPYYQITNILWFKRHCPDLYKKTRHIVKANTYLNYRLTGEYGIDKTQAVMSLAYDILEKKWSDKLAEAINIPLEQLLPPVYDASHILGTVTNKAASETGLSAGTPVVVSSVDTALALLEIGLTRQGIATEITGTSSNNLFVSETMPPKDSSILWFQPLIETKEVPNLLFAPTNTTGEALRWARTTLGMQGDTWSDGKSIYNHINQLVSSANCGSNGMFFYPYLLGERAPLWSNSMRGMFVGASIKTTQGDMLRSVYEGTSFALKEICEEAKLAGARVDCFRLAGGCAKSDIWTKIKASILDMPIEVIKDNGGAPKGNAILGGYSIGIYKDFNRTVENMYQCEKTVEPDPRWAEHYRELYPVFLSIRNSVADDLERLANITQKYDVN